MRLLPLSATSCLFAGHGEEMQAKRLRAKLRWARLRASLAAVITLRDAARPLPPPRIAGPAVIRTAAVPGPAVGRLLQRLEATGEQPPSLAPSLPSSLHGSVLAVAAAAAAAELEDGGAEEAPSSPTAAWVAAASPQWPVPGAQSSASFHFHPPAHLSRSAPS